MKFQRINYTGKQENTHSSTTCQHICLGYPSLSGGVLITLEIFSYCTNLETQMYLGNALGRTPDSRECSWTAHINKQLDKSSLFHCHQSFNRARVENWLNSTPHWLKTPLQQWLNSTVSFGTQLFSLPQGLEQYGNLPRLEKPRKLLWMF